MNRSAGEGLEGLREGDRRFVAGRNRSRGAATHTRRAALADEGSPFANLLGCSDSRAPAEIHLRANGEPCRDQSPKNGNAWAR